MKKGLLYVFILLMLTGCADIFANNNATRLSIAQIENSAELEIARTNANAIIQSQMYESNANIMQAQVAAMQNVSIHSMWTGQIPIILAGIGVIILLAIILHYRGKISLEREKRQQYLGNSQIIDAPYKILPEKNNDVLLEEYARSRGGTLQYHNDIPYLLTSEGHYKRLTVKYE